MEGHGDIIELSEDINDDDGVGSFGQQQLGAPSATKPALTRSAPKETCSESKGINRLKLVPCSEDWQSCSMDSDWDKLESESVEPETVHDSSYQESPAEIDPHYYHYPLPRRTTTHTGTTGKRAMTLVIDTNPVSTPTTVLPAQTWIMDPQTGALLAVPDEDQWMTKKGKTRTDS